jgi:hypothetical protein
VDVHEPVVQLDLTVRPCDDVISNGDFEDGLDDWETMVGSMVVPTVVTDMVRSGGYSVALGKESPTSGHCGVTQTVNISATMYMPTLSFWYRTPSTDGDGEDSLEAGIYHGDPWTYHLLSTIEPSQQWTHTYLDLSSYTGEAWISFNYRREGSQDFIVYLDEVSLGRASGGPLKTYLPLVL